MPCIGRMLQRNEVLIWALASGTRYMRYCVARRRITTSSLREMSHGGFDEQNLNYAA